MTTAHPGVSATCLLLSLAARQKRTAANGFGGELQTRHLQCIRVSASVVSAQIQCYFVFAESAYKCVYTSNADVVHGSQAAVTSAAFLNGTSLWAIIQINCRRGMLPRFTWQDARRQQTWSICMCCDCEHLCRFASTISLLAWWSIWSSALLSRG